MRLPAPVLALLLLTLGLLAAPGLGHAAPLDAADKARIDRAVEAILKQTTTPSASIAVVKDGQIAYVRAYGLARLSPPLKSSAAARYQIASVSKEITAAAALLLQQDGKLSLDDKVSKWFPDLTAADRITLRQLLTHTSGYSDYWPQDYQMNWLSQPTTPDRIMAGWAKRPLDFQPGDEWQYSNTGYVVAAAIVQQAAGEPFFAFVDRRIFKPVGIIDAVDADQTPLRAPDALGYDRKALGPQRPQPPAGAGWMFGAWPFALTAEDLARWDLSILNQSLLTPDGYAQELAPYKLNNGKDSGYALGLQIGQRNGRRWVHHGGEGSGYLSENRVYPDDKVAVIVLTNTFSGHPQGDIADAIDTVVLAPRGIDPKVRALFDGLQHGHPDRTAFTPAFNAYLDRRTVADYASTLGPLGAPTVFRQTGSFDRGGMKSYEYRIVAGGKALNLSTYVTKDGKFEQFLVSAASN